MNKLILSDTDIDDLAVAQNFFQLKAMIGYGLTACPACKSGKEHKPTEHVYQIEATVADFMGAAEQYLVDIKAMFEQNATGSHNRIRTARQLLQSDATVTRLIAQRKYEEAKENVTRMEYFHSREVAQATPERIQNVKRFIRLIAEALVNKEVRSDGA